MQSSLLGSANGTCTCARTAVDALGLVDNVLAVALRNAAYGTLVRTCATGDAIIINLISHLRSVLSRKHTSILRYLHYSTIKMRNQHIFSQKIQFFSDFSEFFLF